MGNEEKVTAIKFLITDEPINNTYVLYSTVDKIFGYQIIEKGVSKKNSIGIWGKQIFNIDCSNDSELIENERNGFDTVYCIDVFQSKNEDHLVQRIEEEKRKEEKKNEKKLQKAVERIETINDFLKKKNKDHLVVVVGGTLSKPENERGTTSAEEGEPHVKLQGILRYLKIDKESMAPEKFEGKGLIFDKAVN